MTLTLRLLNLVVAGWAAMAVSVAADPPTAEVAAATHVADAANESERFDQSRLVRELMRRRGGDPAATAHLIQLTRQFEPAAAAAMFDELAGAHLAAGNLDLAAETRRALVLQYSNEPCAADATLWLVQLYASSEVAVAQRRRSGASGSLAELTEADQGLAMYALSMAGGLQESPDEDQRSAKAAGAYQRYAAARRAGLSKAADGFLTSLKRLRAGDAWGDCARAEAWLAESRDEPCPKPVAHGRAAGAPPHLDGTLDDPCWQGDAALAFGDETNRAVVRLAYDDQYLYLAVACARAEGVAYPRDERRRPHDGELSGNDRVRLRLDADRDYATWFELTVDSRAWTADRCWDDPAWNPDWYVAAGKDAAGVDARWTVEAAVPWSELAIEPPAAGAAWACAVDRATPGAAPQCWQGDPAEPAGPTHFGLLLFD